MCVCVTVMSCFLPVQDRNVAVGCCALDLSWIETKAARCGERSLFNLFNLSQNFATTAGVTAANIQSINSECNIKY